MPIISLSNVTKSFGTQVLLEDTTFAVNPNDRIGIVGANGTGKTTLLRL
ncbi:ATP-binding cassette domain-containing protein, partial [bacterium]|nr:ATP-binding cassette domain-containing protein [bacterium]